MKRIALLTCLFALAACGEDETPSATPADIYASDIPGTDVTVGPDVPTAPPAGQGQLSFALEVGDDGVACADIGDHCSLLLSTNAQRSLEVRYTVDGAPMPSSVIYFEITEDPMDLGSLTALSAYTDADGVGSVDVKSVKPSQGELVVKAFVLDESVAPLYFDIIVSSKSQVPLTVSTEYSGEASLSSWVVRLYAQGADGEPSCEDPMALYEASVPATIQGPPKQLSQTAKFLEFPGLADGGQERFTVLAFSESLDGTLLAWGCDDVEAVVSTTTSTNVLVPLVDRPPTFAGTYNVTTFLDLTTGIPEPYKTTVDLVLGLFESPSGQLLSLACAIAPPDSTIEDLCGLVYVDPTNPSLDDLTATGAVVVDLIDSAITDLTADTAWGAALTVGKDVADMLRGLELHATLTFSTEPGPDMAWSVDETAESWDGVTLKWGLNANCDPEVDESCGEKSLFMTAIQPEAVSGAFEASLDEELRLSIVEHNLNLYYGALLDSVLQKLVLPLAAGDGSDGLPAINSYEDFILMLVGGGKDCLDPASPLTCCEQLVQSIENQISLPGQSTAQVIESACDQLVDAGAEWLSDSLTGLDSDEGLLIGTASPCASYDVNADLTIDAFGSKELDGMCTWSMTLGTDTPVTFEGSFYAVRAD